MRGNVDTRLGKLRDGEIYATFLARAGLNRLGREEGKRAPLATDEMLPAVGQGAVGVTVRADDPVAANLVAPLNHMQTELSVLAERAFLERLDGSCRTPIACHMHIESMDLRGEVLSPDGKIRWHEQIRLDLSEANKDDVVRLGSELGQAIKEAAGDQLPAVIGTH